MKDLEHKTAVCPRCGEDKVFIPLEREKEEYVSDLCKDCSEKMDNFLQKDCIPCKCSYCGLDLDEHDGSGFCPAGTEEFGGRR